MFENKVALVTGASGGIGEAISVKLAKERCNVIIHYNKNEENAKKVEKTCKNYGVKTLLVKADLSNEEDIKNMVNKILNCFNKIDILVNNAGIAIDAIFEEKNKDDFMKILEVNLVGTFLVSKYVSEIMIKNKYGKIINISSTNGIDKYFPMCLDYDASKAGIISLTHNLALQLAPYVNVNCVAPGWIATENELKDIDQEYIKSEEEKIFIKRIGKPEEVANVVTFLASDEASYINNEVIRVDGGSY